MPNQLNFGKPIGTMAGERGERLFPKDSSIIVKGQKTVLFGVSERDNLEVWFYYPDGSFAATVRIPISDSSIKLFTTIDNTGAFEYIALELDKIAEYAYLSPGRYSMTVYFLRDEVGSRENIEMVINDISPSRREVKLTPKEPSNISNELIKELYEFIVPSVPRIYAKGLVDQAFEKNLDPVPGEAISIEDTLDNLTEIASNSPLLTEQQSNIRARIERAQAVISFTNLFQAIKDRTYERTIQQLRDNSSNINVQYTELYDYISVSLLETLTEITARKELDPRFKFVLDINIHGGGEEPPPVSGSFPQPNTDVIAIDVGTIF